MVSEHLRDQMQSRAIIYRSILFQQAESGDSAMNESKRERLLAFLRKVYNT
jgi:hypothetical protein